MPWAPAEREDSIEVIDWITKQSWSNGQVHLAINLSCSILALQLIHQFLRIVSHLHYMLQIVLSGVSYEATAALFTLSMHHPAIKGCLAQYPFWCAPVVSSSTNFVVGSAAQNKMKTRQSQKVSYCCRDLFNDIAMPGGIANRSFVCEWDCFCKAMDSNDFMKLPGHSALPLKMLCKYGTFF